MATPVAARHRDQLKVEEVFYGETKVTKCDRVYAH
jgi:hypothetical protein